MDAGCAFDAEEFHKSYGTEPAGGKGKVHFVVDLFRLRLAGSNRQYDPYQLAFAAAILGVLAFWDAQRKRRGVLMAGIARPKPSIVDKYRKHKVEGGRQYYFDPEEQRYYSWDSLHGEFEVFDRRGLHLGSVCPQTGITIKPAVRGRRFNPN